MPTNNAIINGTFSSGSFGWSGTDLETSHRETAYLGNGSRNRVAEMDGRTGQTTVMEQTFTVGGSFSTELSLESALRNASLSQAGSEGFTTEVLDSSGNIIASMTVTPTNNSWSTYTLPIRFPGAGNYTLRLTEIGRNDSLGAIIDNVSLLICFCADTLITTPTGQTAVQDLRIGDLVETENGPKPLRWIGRRRIGSEELKQNPKLRPVIIRKGALGADLPNRSLRVSRQHRFVSRSKIASRMFGTKDVLVAAARLLDLPGIRVDEQADQVTYYHLMLDAHEIIFAEGAPTESFLATPTSLEALTPQAREELLELLPHLTCTDQSTNHVSPHAIPQLSQQKRYIKRLRKNQRKPLAVTPPIVSNLRGRHAMA